MGSVVSAVESRVGSTTTVDFSVTAGDALSFSEGDSTSMLGTTLSPEAVRWFANWVRNQSPCGGVLVGGE